MNQLMADLEFYSRSLSKVRFVKSLLEPRQVWFFSTCLVSWKRVDLTNMAMENGPFEDIFAIENRDFPLPC